MRLLSIYSLALEDFGDADLPAYAIASHRWFAAEEETSLQEVQNGNNREKAGYKKIEGFCAFLRRRNQEIRDGSQAQTQPARAGSTRGYRDVVQWIWIDTCCIDQTSSTDVQEAITSMWKWYKQAYICVAYLNDVKIRSDFANSVWFTRGWTLQELLAPRAVIFLDSEWNMFGHKCPYTQCPLQPHGLPQGNPEVLNTEIAQICGISVTILKSPLALSSCPVADRVKWMRGRRTKKKEDLAYSLLGICGVYMPLMYGEGDNAWTRLENEVSRKYDRRIELERPLALANMNADGNSTEPAYILVMGSTGSGKSSFISRVTGEVVAATDGIMSCTNDVESFSFEYDGRLVYLLDTPGFDHSDWSDSEMLRDVVSRLAELYREEDIKLSGIIWLHPINSSRTTASMLKYLRTFKKLCGAGAFSSVVIGTTMWELVNEQDGVRRQELLAENTDFWGDMMANRGARLFRHDDSYDSAMNIVQYILDLQRTVILQVQHEIVEEGKAINETSAIRELEEELNEQKEKFERQLAAKDLLLQQARATHDAELRNQERRHRERLDGATRESREQQARADERLEAAARESQEQQARADARFADMNRAREAQVADLEFARRAQQEEHKEYAEAAEAKYEAMKAYMEREKREKEALHKALKQEMEAMSKDMKDRERRFEQELQYYRDDIQRLRNR